MADLPFSTSAVVELAADSGRAEEMLPALTSVKESELSGEPAVISPLHVYDLERLDEVPEDVLVLFLSLLHTYVWFEPRPDREDIQLAAVEANLRYGTSRTAMEHALLIQGSDQPAAETKLFFSCLNSHGLADAHAEDIAHYLVSWLLDNPATRSAAVEGLAWIKEDGAFRRLVDRLRSELSADELAVVDEYD